MSDAVKNWTEWLKESRFSYMDEAQKEQTILWLFSVRDKILDRAGLKAGDIVIDIGTGTGLLAFGAYERLNGNGVVIATDKFEDCILECEKIIAKSDISDNFLIQQCPADNIPLQDNAVDAVVMRSVLVHILDKSPSINEFYRIIKNGGKLSIFEPIIRSNTRYYELVNPENITDYEKFKQAEIAIMSSSESPLTNFDDKTLIECFEKAGFKEIDLDLATEQSIYTVNGAMIDPWFNTPPSPGSLTMKENFLNHFSEDEVKRFIEEVKKDLDGKNITVKSFSAYISAVK
jgi:arsenite methyltransferase